MLAGLPDVLPFLSAVAPLAVMNFMGTLQCVESAAAAGDRFAPFPTMIVNGVATMAGALLGSCFPTTVYIGHPAWKALGARQGYSILNGVFITLLCTTGLMGLVLAIVPKESASAILLFVGLVIAAQAFEVTPARYYPAIAFGLVPHLAAWGTGILDTLATAAGTSVQAIGTDAIRAAGLSYTGLRTLGEGLLHDAIDHALQFRVKNNADASAIEPVDFGKLSDMVHSARLKLEKFDSSVDESISLISELVKNDVAMKQALGPTITLINNYDYERGLAELNAWAKRMGITEETPIHV